RGAPPFGNAPAPASVRSNTATASGDSSTCRTAVARASSSSPMKRTVRWRRSAGTHVTFARGAASFVRRWSSRLTSAARAASVSPISAATNRRTASAYPTTNHQPTVYTRTRWIGGCDAACPACRRVVVAPPCACVRANGARQSDCDRYGSSRVLRSGSRGHQPRVSGAEGLPPGGDASARRTPRRGTAADRAPHSLCHLRNLARQRLDDGPCGRGGLEEARCRHSGRTREPNGRSGVEHYRSGVGDRPRHWRHLRVDTRRFGSTVARRCRGSAEGARDQDPPGTGKYRYSDHRSAESQQSFLHFRSLEGREGGRRARRRGPYQEVPRHVRAVLGRALRRTGLQERFVAGSATRRHLPRRGTRPTYVGGFRRATRSTRRRTRRYSSSMRRTMSSAAWDAWNLTISRPPTNRNVRTRVPAADAAAMQTMPTGFSAVPPSGPAMPVTPIPMSTPA